MEKAHQGALGKKEEKDKKANVSFLMGVDDTMVYFYCLLIDTKAYRSWVADRTLCGRLGPAKIHCLGVVLDDL